MSRRLDRSKSIFLVPGGPINVPEGQSIGISKPLGTTLNCLILGRFVPEKGIWDILPAIGNVSDRLKFTIAGPCSPKLIEELKCKSDFKNIDLFFNLKCDYKIQSQIQSN